MDKKVAILISNHYNFSTAEYCIKQVVKSLLDIDPNFYDIFIIDTSVKQKDKTKILSDKLAVYGVRTISLDHDYAVNSKKNIFYEQHIDNYELFIEMENDVFFEVRNYQWLNIAYQAILDFESKKDKNVVWSFSYDRLSNLITAPTACRVISRKIKKIIGEYPSEYTGQYENNIEEMVFFPRDTQNTLAKKEVRTCVMANIVDLKFDLYSISTNFINYFRNMVTGFDYLRLDLSDEQKQAVDMALTATKERYEEHGPYPKLSILGTRMNKSECLSILNGNTTLSRGVDINMYKKIYTSIFVLRERYFELERKYGLDTGDLLERDLLTIYNEMYFFNLAHKESKEFEPELVKEILQSMVVFNKEKNPMILISRSDMSMKGTDS